jgi:Flp pilus assembly pilin Flp
VLGSTREEGLSRVEYALILILIAIIIIATLVLVSYLLSVISR